MSGVGRTDGKFESLKCLSNPSRTNKLNICKTEHKLCSENINKLEKIE